MLKSAGPWDSDNTCDAIDSGWGMTSNRWNGQGQFDRRAVSIWRLLAALALMVSLATGLFNHPAAGAQETSEAPPEGGPVVVVLNNQASFRGASVVDQIGAEPTQVYDTIFNGFAADLDGAQIEELSQNPQVAAIVPDIPFYGDADYPPSIARAGLQDEVAQGSGASIAIVDSGIAPHSALNIVGGVDCMNSGGYFDTAGHGTHVAGIAAASGGSSIGSAPGASLYAVKVLDGAAGANPSGSLSSVLCGLNWVAANAGSINAVNMSLSASGSGATACSDASDPLHGAVCAVVNAGVPIIAAAGNSNSAGGYIPAAYPEVIGVASLTDYNGMPGGGASRPGYCPGSNDGADDTISNFSNYGSLADLAAPGTCILSTYPGGGYAYMSGTSMAAPLVTGVVATHGVGWLFSSGTKPQASAAGYSGSKSAGPVLYASDVIITPTPVVTPSPTTSITPTLAPCQTATGSATALPTTTATSAPTVTATPCATVTATLTPTATQTATATSTSTATATNTSTATATATNTITATATTTPSATAPTVTSTVTASPTATRTPTVTATNTLTATATRTVTATSTIVPTATRTPTATATNTATSTLVPTATRTATATSTIAPTATFTSTPTRTPSPTIVPTANPGSGRITGTGGDGVNCRSGAGTGYSVITVLAEGAVVPLNGPAANGWQPVICGGRAGYVSTAYITIVTQPSTATPTPTRTPTVTPGPSATPTKTLTPSMTLTPSVTPTRTPTGVATATWTPSPTVVPTVNPGSGRISGTGGGGVNCRTGAGTNYPVITVLAEGATVPLRGAASGGWQPVTCAGQPGWVSSAYITIVTPAPTATPPGPTPTRTPTKVVTVTPTRTPTATTTSSGTGRVTGTGGGGVNCRTGAGTSYSVITVLAEGATVPLRGPASGGWQPVTCANQPGWVSSAYITVISGSGAGAATVVPTTTPTATSTATSVPTNTATMVPTNTATATVTATETSTATSTVEPTSTATATATSTNTPEPTATVSGPSGQFATVSGTDGEGVLCRAAPSTDGTPLMTVAEGSVLPVTGEALDGWVPVMCADGVPGYVSTTYLVFGAADAGAPTPGPTVDEAVVTETATEESEPTAEASVEPTETPLPIVGIADSEGSGTEWSAIDNDPATSWTVWPSLSPQRVELTIDLGQSQPVDRLTLETDAWNTLPGTEVWLSDDGVTWWNVTWIDGGSLAPDTVTTIPLGYWARFVKLVVPHADQTGFASFGGIRQLDLWASPSGDALPLSAAGAPTTPEPEPTQPVDVIPTEAPATEETAAPVETVPVVTEVPVETVPAEGSPPA